jgi:type II restriction enzyme
LSAPNNQRVLDFRCSSCREEYELKSKRNAFSRRVVDGAYRAMMQRLQANQAPSFYFLAYDLARWEVINFFVVPSYFLLPESIERRNPLKMTARRAGWTGCNILLDQIPESGRIHYIQNKRVIRPQRVRDAWERTAFLKDSKDLKSRGWTVDVMHCIERLDKSEFSLKDIYAFEQELKNRYPKNNFVKDKIRQQLQKLRDKDYIEFKGNGKYRRID